jgi:uncharacterized membrane protein
VSYDDTIAHVVDVVEGVGVAIMVLGASAAFALFAQRIRRGSERAYQQLREDVGRVILLGLEVLIIADIIRTIVVERSLESVAVLGSIVVIRILLSFSLEVEIEGAWPWRRASASMVCVARAWIEQSERADEEPNARPSTTRPSTRCGQRRWSGPG